MCPKNGFIVKRGDRSQDQTLWSCVVCCEDTLRSSASDEWNPFPRGLVKVNIIAWETWLYCSSSTSFCARCWSQLGKMTGQRPTTSARLSILCVSHPCSFYNWWSPWAKRLFYLSSALLPCLIFTILSIFLSLKKISFLSPFRLTRVAAPARSSFILLTIND